LTGHIDTKNNSTCSIIVVELPYNLYDKATTNPQQIEVTTINLQLF